MISFEVKDMTCGHCVRAITEAVKAVDVGADVGIDLATHRVDITPSRADAAAFGAAITQAGYSPLELGLTAASTQAGGAARGGCCGGGGQTRCCC